MENSGDEVKTQLVEARARNISHNVRCTECGSQSIEDSQADIAILLRKLIREEIRSGKTDKEIFKKLEDDFGDAVLYEPNLDGFDFKTTVIFLSPALLFGAGVAIWTYQWYREKTNVHIMALNLIRSVPLTPNEKQTMLTLITPKKPKNALLSWWRRWRSQ
ncbi:CcmH/CycL/Ccl2/NrfF family [Parasponia andersonii]|uniref:Cytochrome c-type biogenesis protein n=1 Tax=Parasponia andersonii TaxID=3476 RepID=A0A2P5A5K0_PARAD|nr:CcmH/CycL/Ccl2/NrfF family [Parasponia andersonii]